jgi:hypothetical protein
MPNRLGRGDFERFAKAKGLDRPSRVMAGGLRAVYRHPDQVRLVQGYDVNGTREPAEPDDHAGKAAPSPASSSDSAADQSTEDSD